MIFGILFKEHHRRPWGLPLLLCHLANRKEPTEAKANIFHIFYITTILCIVYLARNENTTSGTIRGQTNDDFRCLVTVPVGARSVHKLSMWRYSEIQKHRPRNNVTIDG